MPNAIKRNHDQIIFGRHKINIPFRNVFCKQYMCEVKFPGGKKLIVSEYLPHTTNCAESTKHFNTNLYFYN